MIPVSYNLRSLAVRKTTTIATALGIALVVFVNASAMMLSDGIKRTLGSAGKTDVAVVLRKGSDAEMTSTIEEPTVGLVYAAPGVKRSPQGTPLGVAELVTVIALDKVGVEGVSNVMIRGITEGTYDFRQDTRIISGQKARPGTDEVVIGQRIQGRFKGLELGQSFELRKNRPVKVVGVFSDNGSAHESEVWADLNTVRTSFGREALVSSVRVRLEAASKFDAFRTVIEQDKQLLLMAQRETVFLEKQSEQTSDFVMAMGKVITYLFSIGAMLGAMITMYASIANRQREIGTLRALGFSRISILGSFLLESIFLAIFGGLIGAFGSLAMSLVKFSMVNFMTWSEMVFSFNPTPEILVRALSFAGVMGILGGFFPALRASKMSPLQAMRG